MALQRFRPVNSIRFTINRKNPNKNQSHELNRRRRRRKRMKINVNTTHNTHENKTDCNECDQISNLLFNKLYKL